MEGTSGALKLYWQQGLKKSKLSDVKSAHHATECMAAGIAT
jgi:hypothetical protein